ncbi:hypothetical protein M432DRAFT_381855 [Thermoascus aurantiacus ATCC 26904]
MSSPSVQIQQPQSSSASQGIAPRSSNSTAATAAFDVVRCSRCQLSLSLENTSSSPGVVQFGMNSYYCSRCASMVGFNR